MIPTLSVYVEGNPAGAAPCHKPVACDKDGLNAHRDEDNSVS